MAIATSRVTSSDGVRLAVYESGADSAPTVVAVHGFPDNHHLWDGVVDLLSPDLHVVTYDVRGCGESDKPGRRSAYRTPLLVDDLIAVLDGVSPHNPVHLLGHDWGSIQLWSAVTDPRLAGRIASFTSISGPSLDYSVAWLRNVRAHPRASLTQFAQSYYMLLFQLPGLPELAVRRGLIDRGVRREIARTAGPGSLDPESQRTEADALNGIWLYRANVLGPLSRPRPVPADVPVQVIVPDQDPFATPQLSAEAPVPWVADLTISPIAGGHWIVLQRPDVIADLTREFVQAKALTR